MSNVVSVLSFGESLLVVAVFCAALAFFSACSDPGPCCAPPPIGTLQVTTVTTGVNPDPDGYLLVVTSHVVGEQLDSNSRVIGINAILIWDILVPEVTHTVELSGVESNCMTAGDNQRPLTVAADDTVSITFSVDCS